ncbi:MAG: thioredoxin [Candidatus Shapirobacteria bacterium]|jgi:thioredoxin 1
MSHIVGTEQNFKTEVLDYKGKVLVDFWAPWCGPCQMLTPIIEEIALEQTGKLKVVKVNVDEQQSLSSQYGISGIPAVFIFINGELKEQIIGFRQKQDYLSAIEKY